MNKKTATGKRAACGILSLSACILGAGPWAYALDYYTWIDQYGITHLSEEAPANGHARRRHIDIPVPATRSEDPDADYYSIANQNRRMQAHRREREKLLAERQLELERIKLQREQIALRAYQSESLSQPNVVSGWREDPGTAYAEYRYLGDYGGYRGKSHRRGYGNRRHYGSGYRGAQGHGHRGRGSARSRSIGVTRPARPVGPGSRF